MKTFSKTGARRGFTLIELIVVIGLMGMLGTIATAGYHAATRGMTESGIVHDVEALIKLAEQTRYTENVPTAVVLYNEPVAFSGEDGDDDMEAAGGAFRGVAVVVKGAGRISMAAGGRLYDEFADLNRSYATKGSNSGKTGMNLYRMASIGSGSGLDSIRSRVKSWVVPSGGPPDGDWFGGLGMDYTAVRSMINRGEIGNRWGFEVIGGIPAGGWRAGDVYGVEQATVILPKGYWFGNNPPTGNREVHVQNITFHPTRVQPGSVNVSHPPVKINGMLEIRATAN